MWNNYSSGTATIPSRQTRGATATEAKVSDVFPANFAQMSDIASTSEVVVTSVAYLHCLALLWSWALIKVHYFRDVFKEESFLK